jgi:hypothetical protein
VGGDTLRSERGQSSPAHTTFLGTNGTLVEDDNNKGSSAPAPHYVMEGHVSAEVGMIALDCLGLYAANFSPRLLADAGCGAGRNELMRKCFDIHLYYLQVS